MTVDSESMGDASRHLPTAELEASLSEMAPAPAERGRLTRIVTRREGGRRAAPDRIALTPEAGVAGDAWGRHPDRKPDAQVTVMQAKVAELIANGQPLELFGDNLFLDLDLSLPNLPPGARVRIGDVVLEVTPLPHNGCRKFKARFGEEAWRFVGRPDLRERRLRGIHVRVVMGGEVAEGDEVVVVHRPPPHQG